MLVRLELGDSRTESFLFGGDTRDGAFGADGASLLASLEPDTGAGISSPRGGDARFRDAGVSVAARPQLLASQATDWHGLTLAEAARRALWIGRGHLISPAVLAATDSNRLDHGFWRALLRGSVQGGVYALERASRRAGATAGHASA